MKCPVHPRYPSMFVNSFSIANVPLETSAGELILPTQSAHNLSRIEEILSIILRTYALFVFRINGKVKLGSTQAFVATHSPPRTSLADGKFEKVLVGATRAVYGDGAQIEHLFTGEQSRRFVIENLGRTCTSDVLRNTLEMLFSSVIDLKVIEGIEMRTAIITMSSCHEAEQAIAVLKVEMPAAIKGIRGSSVYGIPEALESQKAKLSSIIEICCHYPSRLAWAHYKTEHEARSNARRLNETPFDGRKLTCHFQEPTYTFRRYRPTTNYSVTIANLPENVTTQDLLRRTRANDISLNDPLYTTAEFKSFLAEILPSYGTLLSLETSPTRPVATKLYAFAKYASVQESRKAIDALSTGKHPIKVYTALIKSIKYSVCDDVWQVVEQRVRRVVNDNPDDPASSVRLSFYEVDETSRANRKFRIYSKDLKTLCKVKAPVDSLVHGEVFVHENGIFWHELFESAAGTRFLDQLSIPGVAALIDIRTRTIRFYGEKEPRNTLKTMIVDHVKALKAQQAAVSLTGQELRYLLCGGLRTLQDSLGQENVRLDITKSPELIVKKGDLFHALSLIRLESASTLRAAVGSPQKDCSICFCEAEDLVNFDCGHSSCRSCVSHYISSTLRSRSVPISCITCAKPIALAVLHQFREFEELLLVSFKSYISLNPATFENCPTADCPQVYRVGSLSDTVVQCSECLIEICTFCKVIWHEGMTCAEMKESMNPDSLKNKELMVWLGIRPCPRCSTNIEKIAGCNHMTCGGCQTHICWLCMRDFGLKSGQLVYEHIRNAHGNRLFEGQ